MLSVTFCGAVVLKVIDQKTLVKRRWSYNDLPDSLNSTVRLFADDALLYGTICCDEDTADLQEDLCRLEDWQQKWKT